MGKIIYSCLVGGYDEVPEHPLVVDGWRYVLFTDSNVVEENMKGWEIRPLQHQISNDSVRTSRWHKINSHILFPEAELTIYFDANIIISGKELYDRIKVLLKKDVIISCVQHPVRNCVYDEVIACIRGGRDRKLDVIKNYDFLKANKYPENNGLFETGLLFRNNKFKNKIGKFNEDWWRLVQDMSRRDQLSFDYVLWKNKIKCESFFLVEGISVRNAPGFEYRVHEGNKNLVEITFNDLNKLKNKVIMLRDELKNEISDAFLNEVKREIKNKLNDDIGESIKTELIDQLRAELSTEILNNLKDDLKIEMKNDRFFRKIYLKFKSRK